MIKSTQGIYGQDVLFSRFTNDLPTQIYVRHKQKQKDKQILTLDAHSMTFCLCNRKIILRNGQLLKINKQVRIMHMTKYYDIIQLSH